MVLSWNDWPGTLRCLERVFRSDYPDYRVILVDNGSRDGSMERFQAWAEGRLEADESVAPPQLPAAGPVPKPIPFVTLGAGAPAERGPGDGRDVPLTLIQAPENLGYAGGNNIGIAHALRRDDADHVMLLNNDALVAPGTVRGLVAAAGDSGASVVGARLWDERGTCELFAGACWPGQLFGLRPARRDAADPPFWETSYGDGCALLIRGDLLARRFAEDGYYIDPAYFIYWEDVDLGLYARARGGRCVVARDAVVYHGVAKSMGGRANPRGLYYQTRNRVYLANRWLEPRWKVLFHAYYAPSRVVIQALQRSRWRRDVLRAVAVGLRDGYAGVMGKWEAH